jgi:hypothetical protein
MTTNAHETLEWHRQYGDYFVVLKDQTEADWLVVIKHPGNDNLVRFQLAADLDDARSAVDTRMLQDFNARPTGNWIPA